MGEVWPSSHVNELCLHSQSAHGLEMEMNTDSMDYRVLESSVDHGTTFTFTFTRALQEAQLSLGWG